MKELDMLAREPGPGISCWPINPDDINNLQAQIQGPQDSPYAGGTFLLSLKIPDRYPFEPPLVRFTTPIYHPNIDSDGRICLDTLKMQPQGSWSPSININTLLLTIRMLMGAPNADDGLVPDITEEYKRDRALWRRKALEHTQLHAMGVNDIDQETGKNDSNNKAAQLPTHVFRGAGQGTGGSLSTQKHEGNADDEEEEDDDDDSDDGEEESDEGDSDDDEDDHADDTVLGKRGNVSEQNMSSKKQNI